LSVEPDNERAASNKQWYEKVIADKQQEAAEKVGGGDRSETEFVNRKNNEISRDFDNYERLCRGEQTRVRSSLLTHTHTHTHARTHTRLTALCPGLPG